jgi:hypothetical protein
MLQSIQAILSQIICTLLTAQFVTLRIAQSVRNNQGQILILFYCVAYCILYGQR